MPDRKTIIIISLLSALFSFIFLLLDYYGYIRYMKMYVFSSESYIPTFKKLESASSINKGNKVVIYLLSSPEKVSNIKPTINSILDQTVSVNEITLCCDSSTQNIKTPSFLDKIVKINNSSPNEVFNNIIINEGESDTLIILLKDGEVYGKDFVETVIEFSSKNLDEIFKCGDVLAFKSKNLKKDINLETILKEKNIKEIKYYENYKRF